MDGPTLFKKLLQERGLNPTSLAAALNKPTAQSNFHRFNEGTIKNPRRDTLELAAKHLGVNVLAFFDSQLADSEWQRISGEAPTGKPTAAQRVLLHDGLCALASAARTLEPQVRNNVAELLALVVKDPVANAEDQIPIIVRKLSGEFGPEAAQLKPTGTRG